MSCHGFASENLRMVRERTSSQVKKLCEDGQMTFERQQDRQHTQEINASQVENNEQKTR